ncbi:hypothetical protein B0T26DRAFT_400163 [Lasiosphaeria miniovina]|uniref:Uncharacterized protein n=1 Tax=Lasiosphaeria miniovina TaxID=1954250 RepID=A0AA40A4U0_9PEZI|nr:uncharacterized protein B0T26DRAFT_400163 [Lasiosphaeria miniovina]KAK0709272.1 hypothetical protein B0T26DRAFT_400163 [Lasiosphaeria miniovina]
MMSEHEWPEAHRKRLRDDEYADVATGGSLGFTEHRSKRLQTSLPLRTSPTSKRWAEHPTFPPSIPSFAFAAPISSHTITPGNSDSDEASMAQDTWADEPEINHYSANDVISEAADDDMDMTEASDTIPINGGPAGDQGRQHLAPGLFHPDPATTSVTGRMPTPIHCSFGAQVRGNNRGGAAGSALRGEPLAMTPEEQDPNALAFSHNNAALADALHHRSGGMIGHESVPRSFDGSAGTAQVMADWGMAQNRRLPSPISESGGEDSLESPRMVLDSSSQHMCHGHPDHAAHQKHIAHHQQLSLNSRFQPHAGELGPDTTSPSSREGTPTENGSAMDVESSAATPSPGRKGHTRSRHTLNSWTALQPGMKRSFSIGYRSDCEKCRQKVPGHFNHIIIS